jgi:hypothetical protein
MDRRQFTKVMGAVVAGMAAGTRALAQDKMADAKEKHVCKGHNACKGQGGCGSGDAGCAGKNTCKGKGGCKVDGAQSCKGMNECKGKGGCKTGDC